MRTIALAALLAGSVFATPAAAQSFVGEWRATAEIPDGTTVSETILVERAGDGYAISVRDVYPAPADGTSAGQGLEIAIEGDTFSYKRIARTPQADIEILYKGTVSGDSFAGTAEIGGFSVPYNGERTTPAS